MKEENNRRNNIIKLVDRMILGPLYGENEILDTNPLNFYSTGILYPEGYIGGGRVITLMESNNNPEIDEDVDLLSGEDSEENYIPDKPGHFKSSIGLNFSIDPGIENNISMSISFDKYRREDDKYKLESYIINEIYINDIKDTHGEYQQITLNQTDEKISVQYIVFKENNSLLVSIKLLNENLKNEEINEDENYNFDNLLPYVYFRTKITIKSKIGFLPLKKSILSFNIDEDFERLFNSRKSFSSGVNISSYSQLSDNESKCYQIETSYNPRSNQKILNADVYSDNPEKISLSELLNVENLISDPKILASRLREFNKDYSEWINELKNKENSKKHRRVYSRIDHGISLIESNDAVKIVFIDTLKAIMKQYQWAKNDQEAKFRFRPFQLAFMLMLIPDVVKGKESDFYSEIDLLWIPTGGGKTEAYLAISGFTILWNRYNSDKNNFKGRVSILTRYTLRLLTSQQFQRSSRMILALDRIRNDNSNKYGHRPISIGILVGSGSTPNDTANYLTKLREWIESGVHPFPLQSCPICGNKLNNEDYENRTNVSNNINSYLSNIASNIRDYNFNGTTNVNFRLNLVRCLNQDCQSKRNLFKALPVYFIDDDIFKIKPDFLLATVDKLAMINFGKIEDYKKLLTPQPTLILQDELHLINSSLGTIFSNFESGIESYFKIWNNNSFSKIITSTATPKNSEDQLQFLFGRGSNIFPPSGDTIEDSYYSKFIENLEKSRSYIGYLASGMPEKNFERDLSSAILAARIFISSTSEEINNKYEFKSEDSSINKNFKTLVAYFNSLRELGGYTAMVDDDIRVKLMDYLYRLLKTNDPEIVTSIIRDIEQIKWNSTEYDTYGLELTSNKTAEEIQEILSIYDDREGSINIIKIPDVVSATNMISVGIDIEQFNIMIVCGQPKSVSEYIQSTSRVGRTYPGVVFVSHNPNKIRDTNHFQFFESFHKSFYKYSDPSTVSPYSIQALERIVPGIILSLVSIDYPRLGNYNLNKANEFAESLEQIKNLLDKIDEILPDFPNNIHRWDKLYIFYNTHILKYNNLNTKNFNELDKVEFIKIFNIVLINTLTRVKDILISNAPYTVFKLYSWVKSYFGEHHIKSIEDGARKVMGVDYSGFYYLDTNLFENKRIIPPFKIPTSMRNVDTAIDLSILI